MIRATYPNACPSHLKIQVIWRMELLVHQEESSRSNWKLYHLRTFLLKLDEEFRSPPTRVWVRLWHSLPLQSWRWSQRWTSWRRHVSSTIKLEDITMLRSTPSNSVYNFSIILWPCWLVKFGVCMMMFVFMTLFDPLLYNDCWCIVGLLPTMTSVA